MKSLEDPIRRILRTRGPPEDGELGSPGIIGDLVSTEYNEDSESEHKQKQSSKHKNALLVFLNNANEFSILNKCLDLIKY